MPRSWCRSRSRLASVCHGWRRSQRRCGDTRAGRHGAPLSKRAVCPTELCGRHEDAPETWSGSSATSSAAKRGAAFRGEGGAIVCSGECPGRTIHRPLASSRTALSQAAGSGRAGAGGASGRGASHYQCGHVRRGTAGPRRVSCVGTPGGLRLAPAGPAWSARVGCRLRWLWLRAAVRAPTRLVSRDGTQWRRWGHAVRGPSTYKKLVTVQR
jgi:hypothetical protein